MDLRDLTYTYYLRRLQQKSLPRQVLESTVVELGAGIDNYSTLFDYKNYTAVDLDNSLENSNFKYICQDIRHLQFEDDTYHYFIASNVLEHIESPADVLMRLQSICSQGGYIVVPVNGSFPFIYDPVNWIRKKLSLPICNFGIGGFGHVSLLTESEWDTLISNAGFSIVRKSYYSMDVWSCLEFFLFSIFLSRKEYVHLCRKNVVTQDSNVLTTIFILIQRVQRPLFKLLHALSWRMSGVIGVEYLLAKSSRA